MPPRMSRRSLCRRLGSRRALILALVLVGCGGGTASVNNTAATSTITTLPQPEMTSTSVSIGTGAGDGILILTCDSLASVTLRAVDPADGTTTTIGEHRVGAPLRFAVCPDKGRQVPVRLGVSGDKTQLAVQEPGPTGDVGWYDLRTSQTTLMREQVPGGSGEYAPPELFGPAFDSEGGFWFAVRADADRKSVKFYSVDAKNTVVERNDVLKHPPGVLANMDYFLPGRNAVAPFVGGAFRCVTPELADGRQLCDDGFRQFGDTKATSPLASNRKPACASLTDSAPVWLVEPTQLLCSAKVVTVDASGAFAGIRDFLPPSSRLASRLAVDPSRTRALIELAGSGGSREYFVANLNGSGDPAKLGSLPGGLVIGWV